MTTKKTETEQQAKAPSSAKAQPHQKQHEQPSQEKQLVAYKELLQRLQAEFENYKKRTEKEQQQHTLQERHKLISALLPIMDSFELALQNSEDATAFKQGIELLYAQFYALLESYGLSKIEALGKTLDPFRHEVVMKAPGEQDNIITEEFQAGYMLGDAVIRHSKVKVSFPETEKTEHKTKNETEDETL